MPRGRTTSLIINLTDEERRTLVAWQRSTTIRSGYAKRGRAILLLADGVPIVQVAIMAGINKRFVYIWARRFLEHGVEGLIDKPGRGRRPGPH